MKIAFIGLPTSGKTTTAKKVAKELNGVYVPEVARLWFTDNKPFLFEEEQAIITKLQLQLEKEIEQNNQGKLIVCDVPVHLGNCYHYLYTNKFLFEPEQLPEYDIIFKLPAKPMVYDGVRYQSPSELEELDRLIDFTVPTIEIESAEDVEFLLQKWK